MISKLTKYIFIVLIFCFGAKNTAFAQVNSYTFSQTVIPGIYAEITSLNTLNYTVWQTGSAIDVNTISAAVPITFNGAQGGFTFNCKTYGDVFINNNGHICFTPWGGLPLTTYNVISSTAYQVEGAVSAFGANLVASTAVGAAPSISYGNQGANFIIQYKDVARTATPNDRINFQIWLSANGIIRFIYGQCTADASSTSVAAAIVGMRANHFSDMQNRTVSGTSPTADWLNSAPGTTVTSSCRFTNVAPAAAPINNLVYTYTPSNCVVPTYATIPATVNFENAWIGNTSALPSVHWRNWPARGQGAWFRDDENSVATNNWGSPGSGTYSPSGAVGTNRSARFHCATTPTGTYGDLDYYVDLSGCGTNTKFLNFYYNNELGADYLQVFLSTDGGASFTQLGTNIMAANNANWVYQTFNLGTANSNTSVIRFRAFADVVNTEPVASDIGIDEISIGVNNIPPPISISGIGGVCSSGQGAAGSTLIAAGGISYSWSPSIGLNTTTGSTVVSTPTVPTTYTVIGVDAGCNTASSTFMVNISPKYEISFWTQYPNVCVNGTASITISDTINGSSTAPAGYCSTPLHTTSSFCISNVSLGTLNNSSTTCVMPSYTFYNNVAVPVIFGGSNSNISVTLTQSSGAIAVWIDYNRNGIFEPTEYTSITTTSVAGSPAIASINVPAGATAGVTRMRIRSRVAASFITASDACLQFSAGGETEDYLVQIKTVPGNNLNYTWSPSTYLNTTASQSIIATNVASSITYTVNASDAIGCTVSQTVTLNVAPLNCGVVTSNPTLLCLGNAATMYANVTGGGQPYAYQWQGPNANNTASIVISSIDSAIVSPVVNTDYTLTVTDACGTTCSTVFTLNVYQGVIPTIVNANGGPIQICGTNANSISLEVSGGTAYTWTPAPTYQSPTGDSVNIVATGPTLYTVVGSSAGCNGSATVTVPFYPNYLLQVTANPASLCTGSITNLKVTDTINGPQVLPSANYCSTNLHSIGGTHCIDTFNINNVNLNAPAGYVCGTNTYSQFLSASATQLIVGQAYPIQASLFQPGFLSMWIDYNRDGSFDPSEYTSLITNSQVATTSIIVPNFSATGQTIMRLRSSQNPIIPSDYCNSFIYGETKDYIVDISQKSNTNITSYSWSPAAAIASNGNANATTNIINSNTNFVVTTTDANGCTKQSGVQVVVSPLTCGNISIAPSSTVCAGIPTTLTANSSGGGAPNTYKWETSAGIIGTTKSIVINPTTTTTYTATITDACGLASTCVNTVTVTVLPAPSLTLTSNPNTNNICASGTATLSVSGAVSYNWAASLNPSNITAIAPTSVSIAPIQSNEYFVVGVGSNGCTSSISRNITYSANLPLVANTLFDTLTSCNPSTQLLVTDTAVGGNFINSFPYCSSSANSNTSFDITNVQINTNSSSSVCNTLAPGIGSVTSRYSNYTGTTLTTLFTNVQNVYTVSISDCNNTFVTGGFRIYIDWNANGLFTDAGELVASNSSILSGNNSNIGTFTIPSFATAGIVRMRVIAFNGTATGASCGTYAEGETEDYAVEIRRVPQLPYTFTWQPGALTGNAPIVTPAATTVYTVSAVNAGNCTASTSTVTIHVGALTCNPVLPLIKNICLGDTATLKLAPTFGEQPLTYLWSDGSTDSVAKVSPTTTNTYNVIVTDACGSSCSTTFTVIVVSLPSISLASSIPGNTICGTGTITWTASSSATTPVYSWSPATNLSATSGSVVQVVNPTASTTYTIQVTDNTTTCKSSTTATVAYNKPIYVSATAGNPWVCPNTTFTMYASDTVNTNFPLLNTYCVTGLHTFAQPCITNVSINGNSFSSASGCTAPAFTPATSTPVANVYAGSVLTLTATTGANPFSGTAKVAAWIDFDRDGILKASEYQLIQAVVTPGVPDTLLINVPIDALPGNTLIRFRTRSGSIDVAGLACSAFASGETEDYNINIIGVNPTMNTYTWSNGVTAQGYTVSGGLATTTTYTVTASTAAGCSTTTALTISVVPVQVTSISNLGDVCLGETRIVKAQASFGNGSFTYDWQPMSDILVAAGDSAELIPFSNVTYTLTVTDGCGATASSTFLVNANFPPSIFGLPSVPGVCQNGIISLSAGGASTYSWTPSTFLNTNIGSPVLVVNPTSDMTYTVVGTDALGCTASATVPILYSVPFNVNINFDSTAACAGQPITLKVSDTFAVNNSVAIAACASAANITNSEDIVFANFTNLTQSNNSTYALACGIAAGGPGSLGGSYSNFSNATIVPTYYNRDSISFTLVKNNCLVNNNNYGLKIWIDYNRDGDYLDPNEIVYVSSLQNASDTIKGVFKIPNFVQAGKSTMRVVMRATNNVSSITSCGTYLDGETEDYPVNLVNVFNFTTTSISWAPNTNPLQGQTVQATPVVPTIYTVTLVDNAGCTASSTLFVNTNPLTAAPITRAKSGNICLGAIDTLTANPLGGSPPYNYAWSTAATTKNISVAPTSATTYTVVITDACNATTSQTITIGIQPWPIITISANPASASLCTSGTVTLNATCATCALMVWENNGSSNPTAVITPQYSEVYTVIGTDGVGCTNTETIFVNRSYDHVFNFTPVAANICGGDSIALSFVDSTLGIGAQTLPSGYCTPSHTTGTPCITSFIFNQINNSPANNCSTNPVTTYTNTTTVLAGTTVPLFMSFANTAPTTSNAVAAVWIDYNRDGLFSASEFTSLGTNIAPNNTVGLNVNIPTFASAGLTKMRVRIKSIGTAINPLDACVNFPNGSTQDYTLNIVGKVPATNMVYDWQPSTNLSNNSLPNVTATNLSATTIFTVTAVAAGSCTYTVTKTVIVNPKVSFAPTIVNNQCSDGTSGLIVLNPTGGTSPINYTISPNVGNFIGPDSFKNLPIGVYTISSSDVVGCSNSTTVTIGAPAPITGSLNLVGSLCTASQPVNVYATITGGTAPYSFSWFDNAFLPISYTTSALGDTVYNVLPPSELNLLYSDANGCQNSVSPFLFLNLALPSTPLSIGFVTATSPSCFGSTNGTITVQALGGNNSLNGYQFKLNSSTYQSAATFTNVAAGTYTITVLDDNLCTQSLTYTLTQPSILVDSVVATNVKCFGSANGTISHFVQGGTAPFTIFVNSSAPVANYNIGTYNVFVQDANGCTFTTTVAITQPTNLTITATQDSVICNGGSTGAINASAIGGNGGYSYFVNGNPIASGYAAGIYTVQVADVENCTKTTTVTVLQPSPISLNLFVTQPTCSGTNGNILATATGGTGALNYTLNGSAFASSQVPGTYTICAIDMKSCSVCSTVTITNPPTLNLSATAVGPGCGTLLGEITPTATGGSTPYTFFVNGNAYLNGNVYSPNNYTVSVVDNNNCQSTLLVVVPVGTSPLLNNTTANDITCVGKVDGSFNFAASGGTNTGYTYTVNGNTPVANYSAGTYTVTVNDLTSCTVTKILTINNAQPWAVTATGTAALCNGNLGSVTAITNGGATPIDYSINGQPISNGFLAGTYTIVANDANSCSKTTTVTVGAAPAPIVISTTVTNPTCANGIGSITASASGGSGNIAITIDSLAPATSYAPGIYTIMAIDNNACAVTSTVTIASTSNAISITSIATDPLCNAGTGVITNTIVGGVAPIDITVGGLPFDTNYVAGTYTIVATDINSCSASTSVTINPGPSPIVITSNVTQPTCINGFGAVTVTASGGANGISLLIGNAPIALSYPVGVYTIDAVDNSGCTATDVLVVAASSASISIATSSATPTCFGNVAAVSATANGGTPPLTLTIGGQPLNATYASGNYIVVATDNVGCTTSASLIVPTAPSPLNLTLNGVDPLCTDSMGAILATTSGGTSPLNLFEGSNFFASPHLPGTYTITLIDANSCSTTSSVVINPAPIFEVSAAISSTSICSQNSAIATSSIVGANPQSITWSNGILEGTAFVPSFGTNIYTVTATTANCSTSSTVSLTVNAGSGILSQAMLSNVLSTPGTSCNTLLQVDGDTVNYTDLACNLIASVFDPSGGNLLDSFVSCVNVLNTVDSVNNIVFAPRVYKLTPKNNGAANITLYYTNDDLLEYNNHVLTNLISVDTFQTKSSTSNLVNGQSIPGLISKFADELDLIADSIIQVSCVWNSTLQHWEVNFNVPSFSMFRLHTSSNAAPLALNLLHFKGEALQNANHLVWRVNKEENMQVYKVERSFDGNNFVFIGDVKANNLLSQSEYTFDDKDIRIGKVYYRLKMTEFGGNFDYSNTIMLSRESIQQSLDVYPNPVGDELHFTYSTNNNVELIVRLIDVSGRTVRIVNTEVISGKTELNVDVSGLAAGTYVIQATEKDGNITRSQFTKAVR